MTNETLSVISASFLQIRRKSGPSLLFSLSLSLTVFCIGMTLNGVVSIPRSPMWEILAWGLLSLLLLVQTVIYGVAGDNYGWDTSMEGMDNQ